jgi:hypothetical protein
MQKTIKATINSSFKFSIVKTKQYNPSQIMYLHLLQMGHHIMANHKNCKTIL